MISVHAPLIVSLLQSEISFLFQGPVYLMCVMRQFSHSDTMSVMLYQELQTVV